MKLPCLSEEGGTLTYICPMRGGARGGTVTQFGPMRQAEGGSTWLCACCLMEVGEERCLLKEPLVQIICFEKQKAKTTGNKGLGRGRLVLGRRP